MKILISEGVELTIAMWKLLFQLTYFRRTTPACPVFSGFPKFSLGFPRFSPDYRELIDLSGFLPGSTSPVIRSSAAIPVPLHWTLEMVDFR